jgi:hypothetical protein
LAFDAPDVQKEELNEDERMRLRDATASAAGGSQEVKKYYPKGVALPNPIRAPQRNPLSENPNFQNQYPMIYPKPENTMSEGSLSEGKARIFGNSHTFIKPERTGSYSENKWKKPEPSKPPAQQPQETISLISSEEEPSPAKTEPAKIYRAENIYTDSPYFNRGKMDATVDLTVDESTKKRLFPNSPFVTRPENASKVSRRSKLNLDAQSDESDDDDGMDMDIVGGANQMIQGMKGENDFEQSFLRPVLPSLNSTMAPTKRVATLIEDDLNESVSNMSIGDDSAFENIEDSPSSVRPVKKQAAEKASVLDELETTKRMAPGEFKFDSFDMGSSTSASQSQKNKTADSTMSGVVDLPKELDLKEQADEYDSDRTASSCDLEIDERTRIIESPVSQSHQKWVQIFEFIEGF